MANENTYSIGLTMAGAVSAGAYTAGVLSQLMETIDAWYEAKKYNGGVLLDGTKVPEHKVMIEAMSGASAGGMCTALFAVCLAEGNFNRLYNAWVKEIDIKPLLDNSDLGDTDSPIFSLLNTSIIDKISEDATSFIYNKNKPWPTYLHDQIDLYLTLSNLEGIPYGINYNSEMNPGNTKQLVKSHADYIRFKLLKPGINSENIDFLDANILDPLTKQSPAQSSQWNRLMKSAPATGAFPVGLKARKLTRYKWEYEKREWYFPEISQKNSSNNLIPKLSFIKPDWDLATEESFDLEFSDGGLLNNEPFELARRRLALNRNEWINPRDSKKANRSVILIDPFPSSINKQTGSKYSDIPNIFQVLNSCFGAMRSNSLFSQELLYTATTKDIFSRYLISPSRKKNDQHVNPSIACGFFDGFGGFLHNSFRDHDYKLGRHNCQSFLNNHYKLPLENPLMTYITTNNLTQEYKDKGWIDNNNMMSIIPEMPNSQKLHQPDWPQIYESDLNDVYNLAYKRFERLETTLLDNFTGNDVLRILAKFGIQSLIFGKKKFKNVWQDNIIKPLREEYGLIK